MNNFKMPDKPYAEWTDEEKKAYDAWARALDAEVKLGEYKGMPYFTLISSGSIPYRDNSYPCFPAMLI